MLSSSSFTEWSKIQVKSSGPSFHVTKLEQLESEGFLSILEDLLCEISYFKTSEALPRVDDLILNTDSLSSRCKEYLKNDPIFSFVDGTGFEVVGNRLKRLKLHLERAFLEYVLKITRDELYDENSFEQLKQYLLDFEESENAEKTLITDQTYNKSHAAVLKAAVKKKTEESQREIQKTNEQISRCKDEMESFLFDNALKIRYIENWENARIEQGYMQCDQSEGQLNDTINKYKNEIEKEIRINAEIVNYIAENQKDMEEAIEMWMKRYEVELDEKQIQLGLYKDKRAEQKKRYDEMLITFDVHAREIEEWLDYKEKKREREELEKLRNDAATKIQAWWKGMMFRHKLGPWNPDPQPKQKKKDKKKDKKGKKKKKK